MKRLISLVFAALALTIPANAQDLVAGLSQDVIQITSNYAGSDIVVFGAIERGTTTEPRDIVVVLRGPDTTLMVRKKDRVAGVWINRDSATLTGMPAYYFVASTAPLKQIASRDTLVRYGIGLDNLEPKSIHSHHDPEPFRQALIRHQVNAGVYTQTDTGVEFLSETLFRVRVPVPASASPGQYNAEAFLFRNGNVVSAQTTPFFVDQAGLERRIYTLAHNWPFNYGVSAVIFAMLLGWLSSVLFRQNL